MSVSAFVVVLGAWLMIAAPARADFGLTSFTTTASSAQAGAHADVTTEFHFNTVLGPPFGIKPDGNLRTVVLELPTGLIGNAAKLPYCSPAQILSISCPAASRVGSMLLFSPFLPPTGLPSPIYNVQPPGDEPARLVIAVGGNTPQPILIDVRSGADYGLTATVENVGSQIPLTGMAITLWGVPADHNGSGEARVPFMVNPTDCSSTPVTTLHVRSYEHPDQWVVRSVVSPTPTGCDNVTFTPHVIVRPKNPIVDKPSALNVDITIDQNDDPDGLGSPALRDAVVQLPEGVTINPSLAHDRAVCSDGAFAKDSSEATHCPAGSKIGTIGMDVPALRAPLPGDIYLGTPKAGNPFRLFLYAEGQGVRVKLEGSVRPDPKTGQLTTTFADNPQVPFSRFHLRFQGGDNAALLMPPTCGTKNTIAALTPYSSSAATGTAWPFRIVGDAQGGPCPDPQPFAPTFTSGVTNARAGQNTAFTMSFGRPDGHQMLSTLKLHLPAGVLGRLADFPLCSIADSNADHCDDASKVGGTTVSAGSGDGPLNVAGRVYLTEPPGPADIAGLAIVVPAVAGPYNLGTPVVHAGIKVNPDTSLTVESDPLPTILSGVALRIKQVIVTLDRHGFMLNPTDCSPKRIEATIASVGGAHAQVSSPFGVHGCAGLPYEPPFTVDATAPSKDGGTAGLTVHLGGLAGQANTRQVQVVLPKQFGARLEGPVQHACTEQQFAADQCPDAARVGTAGAKTPILSQPLSGPVYFLENGSGGGLPRLAMTLKGQITLPLVGNVALTKSGRITTTFTGVPDVPIDSFDLSLPAGDHAALTGAQMCGRKLLADVDLIAHSGKELRRYVPISVSSCGGPRTGAKSKHHTARGKHVKHLRGGGTKRSITPGRHRR